MVIASLREVNGRAAATKQETLPFCSAEFRRDSFLIPSRGLAPQRLRPFGLLPPGDRSL
jgi:hypothetical protein